MSKGVRSERRLLEARKTRDRLGICSSVMATGAFEDVRLALNAVAQARGLLESLAESDRVPCEFSRGVMNELARDVWEAQASLSCALNAWESFVSMPQDEED